MKISTMLVLAAALALGACKKEEKGADKKDEPAPKAETKTDTKKEEPAPTPTPNPADPAPTTAEPAKTDTTTEAPIAAAAPVVADDSITLGYVAPAVGTKYTEEDQQLLDLSIDMGGNKMQMKQDRVERKTVEILEVKDGVVTKAKYTYEKARQTQSMAGKSKDDVQPIEGKTYILTAGDPISVEGEAGAPPAAEVEAVRDAEKKFGKPDRMAKMLAGKVFKKDEPLELPADQVKEAMGDETMQVGKMTLTFRGMQGGNAMFDMTMAMAGEDEGNQISVELTGKVVVDPAISEPRSMDVSGPFKMSGKVAADGTMKMTGKRE